MFKGLLADFVRARRGPDRRPFFDAADLGRRLTEKSRQLQAEGYLDYPALVHLETRTVCNAACSFCPYETLDRKGTVMPDALIESSTSRLRPPALSPCAVWTARRAIRREIFVNNTRWTYTISPSCGIYGSLCRAAG